MHLLPHFCVTPHAAACTALPYAGGGGRFLDALQRARLAAARPFSLRLVRAELAGWRGAITNALFYLTQHASGNVAARSAVRPLQLSIYTCAYHLLLYHIKRGAFVCWRAC